MSQLRVVAFNFTRWKPDHHEWILANSLIQRDESSRIEEFAYQRDAKASMAGRLLLRSLLSKYLEIPNDALNLVRDTQGKPKLDMKLGVDFDFNVSHHGNFSVVACGPFAKLGVDVMQQRYTGSRPIDEFFRLMRRQFTPDEWDYIECAGDVGTRRIDRFYRLWSLKESYVKAIGIGLGMNLQRISFRVCEELHHDAGNIEELRSTIVEVDGKRRQDWTFHETMLDDVHCVATATLGENSAKLGSYAQLDFTQLVDGLKARNDLDLSELQNIWKRFREKDEAPT